MTNSEAAEVLRGMEAFVNPEGVDSPFVQALTAGAEALELLEWVLDWCKIQSEITGERIESIDDIRAAKAAND